MCGRYTITQDLAELEKLVRFICKVVAYAHFVQLYFITAK